MMLVAAGLGLRRNFGEGGGYYPSRLWIYCRDIAFPIESPEMLIGVGLFNRENSQQIASYFGR